MSSELYERPKWWSKLRTYLDGLSTLCSEPLADLPSDKPAPPKSTGTWSLVGSLLTWRLEYGVESPDPMLPDRTEIYIIIQKVEII